MTNQEKKTPRLASAAIVGAVGIAFALGGAGGAVAANKIHTKNIADNAVTWTKLSSGVRAKVNVPGPRGPKGYRGYRGYTGAKGATGAQGPKGDTGANGAKGDNAFVGTTSIFQGPGADPDNGAAIAHIGGRFADNATLLGTKHLDAGTYLINNSAKFQRIDPAVTASSPVLQLAVRGADGSNLGTCFTGEFPAGPGDIDQTCSDTQLVTVGDGGLEVNVYAFGYNADRSAKGSGEYEAWVNVQAVQINTSN